MVIDDGSTDHTSEVLRQFPRVNVLAYTPNRGKGWALRQGFAEARKKGYRYAITLDADGQHFAEDIPQFIEALDRHPDALVIGNRKMDQETVPGGSTFGRRFSNFWFRLETGVDCPDTQSGYRLYPIASLNGQKYFTRKFEFEIEVLVRAAWKGIPVVSVPVRVHYPSPEERVSHFRPFRDFARISVLNAFLVLISFFYVRPLHFFTPKPTH
jgi:glycosyltransferase involved in cell wall biosynthesis